MNNAAKSVILYVDDDNDDCIFLKTSLEEAGRPTELVCAVTGEEAVRYLASAANGGLPALIVLDLNLPRWDGQTTLQYLKSQPQLAGIPVVILSTSENEAKEEACRKLGAVSYFRKPYRFDGYKEIVAGLFSAMA